MLILLVVLIVLILLFGSAVVLNFMGTVAAALFFLIAGTTAYVMVPRLLPDKCHMQAIEEGRTILTAREMRCLRRSVDRRQRELGYQ